MSIVSTLEALVEAGGTPEMLLAVVRRHEAERARASIERREKDAERQRQHRAHRHSVSRDVTVTSRDSHGPSPHVGERAPVVVAFSSSLRSEELTSEAKASSVNTPKPLDLEKPKTRPPKANRGTRLPDDWEPSADEFDLGLDAGLTDEEIRRAALEFRNYWCSRTRDAAKLSWRLTWQNRVNDIGNRKRERGQRLASSAEKPGGYGQRPSSFADIYVRRHGKVAD